jgi:hypothetical protein
MVADEKVDEEADVISEDDEAGDVVGGDAVRCCQRMVMSEKENWPMRA